MKHFISRFSAFSALLVAGFILIMGAAALGQQSLADAARKANKNRPAEPTTRVITNDDISSPKPPQTLNDESASAKASDDKTADKSDDKSADKDKKKEEKSGDDQAKLDKEWGDKIQAQKDQIALMERELDVLQRENKLRAASYYGDAGTRLRDEKKYAEDDRKYRDQIDAKQKAIDDAKSKLDQMKEDARKAGASPGVIG